MDNFYPDIKASYWSVSCEDGFHEGIISKEDYI
jgi:hypothetical protein